MVSDHDIPYFLQFFWVRIQSYRVNVNFTSIHCFIGESIEMCCEREIHEEVGVKVKDVQYIASQPWPMPSVLMVGCTATASTTTINVSQLPFCFV